MTAFNLNKWFSWSRLGKFRVAQNELFKILIFILIIVLGVQLYCCPLWAPVVSKAFNKQASSSVGSEVFTSQIIFAKTSNLCLSTNVAFLCHYGACILFRPGQVNPEAFQSSSHKSSSFKTSLSISSEGCNSLNCVESSFNFCDYIPQRNLASSWIPVKSLGNSYLDFRLFMRFYWIFSIRFQSKSFRWFSKVFTFNDFFAVKILFDKYKQSYLSNCDNPSGTLNICKFIVLCD